MLRAGFSGIVLTAKPDERALWERYCAETGRSNYGTTLIDTVLSYQLKRRIHRDFIRSGFSCVLTLPWSEEVGSLDATAGQAVS